MLTVECVYATVTKGFNSKLTELCLASLMFNEIRTSIAAGWFTKGEPIAQTLKRDFNRSTNEGPSIVLCIQAFYCRRRANFKIGLRTKIFTATEFQDYYILGMSIPIKISHNKVEPNNDGAGVRNGVTKSPNYRGLSFINILMRKINYPV